MTSLLKIIFLSLLTLVTVVFAFFPGQTLATAGETPFGGFSILVIDCSCSNNYLIVHLPVAGPSPIIYQPGVSTLYEFKKIKDSGVWLLGNVSIPVPCIKRMGGHCIWLGDYPLITIVGTSDPNKRAQSSLSNSTSGGTSGGSDTSSGYQENPTTPNPSRPTGPGGETPAENGQSEAATRADLRAHGVQVAPDLSPTLSPVSQLPNNAIAGAEDLAQDCGPSCNVMVTSAARQAGNPVGLGEHGTGQPVFDLNKDPGLDNYISSNASSNWTDSSGTHYVMPNGDEYLDENYGNTGGTGAHWHVRINANHMQTA